MQGENARPRVPAIWQVRAFPREFMLRGAVSGRNFRRHYNKQAIGTSAKSPKNRNECPGAFDLSRWLFASFQFGRTIAKAYFMYITPVRRRARQKSVTPLSTRPITEIARHCGSNDFHVSGRDRKLEPIERIAIECTAKKSNKVQCRL